MLSAATHDPELAEATRVAEVNALTAAGTFGASLRATPEFTALLAASAAMGADPVAQAAIGAFNDKQEELPGRGGHEPAQPGSGRRARPSARGDVRRARRWSPMSTPRPRSETSAGRRRRSSAVSSASTSPPTAAPAAAAAVRGHHADNRDPRGDRRVRPGPPQAPAVAAYRAAEAALDADSEAQALMDELRRAQQQAFIDAQQRGETAVARRPWMRCAAARPTSVPTR